MSHPSIPVSDSNLATDAASPRSGIAARLVPDPERMGFLPKHFGSRRYLQGENAVYDWMRRLCPDYTGGFWDFVELSNGGFYMRPSKDSTYMHLRVDGNGLIGPCRLTPPASSSRLRAELAALGGGAGSGQSRRRAARVRVRSRRRSLDPAGHRLRRRR
jgi:hypothetical protein